VCACVVRVVTCGVCGGGPVDPAAGLTTPPAPGCKVGWPAVLFTGYVLTSYTAWTTQAGWSFGLCKLQRALLPAML
jgi:hypothetical protein